MGIDYGLNSKKLNYKKYSSSIEGLLKKYKVKFIFEPGRSIIGYTACVITKVIYVKSSTKKNFHRKKWGQIRSSRKDIS